MTDERTLLHPRDDLMQTMERIYRSRMTTTSGGNLSVCAPEGIWITPARVDKGNLRRDDMVCVGQDGRIHGAHRPSSEFPFHKAIYDARADLQAIVHAHPVALVAFSICRQLPDTRLFHQANYVCGEPGFAPYAMPGSEELGRNIAHTFRLGTNCVILENHGVVVGGQSLAQAFQRFEALEFAGKSLIKAKMLGPTKSLTDKQLEVAHQRQVRLEPVDPPPASSDERELRRQLCDFLKRGCRQRLFISTEGSFSARLDRDSFLITPSQEDRELLSVDDLVLVDGDTCERGKFPSRATYAHQAIYRRHPDVQAIVFAHPVNATAFSVTDAEFDARTIPESYLFLRDVRRVAFGTHYLPGGEIAEHVSLTAPAAILENDGVMVVGRSILDTFDRLEVLETTAEAIINSRAIGPLVRMSDDVIRELQTIKLT